MRNPIIALKSKRADRGQHAGLLLQRYLCENATGEGGNPEEKRAILQAAITAATNDDVRALYRAAFDRWSASLPTDPAPVDLATTGRLIVGLGSENVLETGIRLNHNYGMPIIPGSALKGLASHFCDQAWGPTDKKFKKPTKVEDEAYRKFLAGNGPKPDDNFHRLLFGSTDDSGCITFHDAWLTPDSQRPLALDVMTPHHPKWLDGSVPPTDFDSPTPVPFLSVTGKFRIAVSWHGPASDEANNWTELAVSLVCDALKDWGIGGKTTSGYGRLVPPDTLVAAPGMASALTTTTGFHPSSPAPSGAQATIITPPGPQHEKGAKITVTCIEPADGKKKAKFKADDGFIGHVASDQQPAVSADQTLELWVANRSGQGYTLSTTEPTKKQKQSNDRKKGGRGR